MTELLDHALEAARRLTPEEQDDIARILLQLLGNDASPVPLADDERDAVHRSKRAAERGEFASDDEVRAVFAKYGL